jgi:hypothetical protein
MAIITVYKDTTTGEFLTEQEYEEMNAQNPGSVIAQTVDTEACVIPGEIMHVLRYSNQDMMFYIWWDEANQQFTTGIQWDHEAGSATWNSQMNGVSNNDDDAVANVLAQYKQAFPTE